jgi:mercuric ion transport protein
VSDDVASESDQRKGVAATGSVIGALLASSCCVGPLVLIAVGASGPWIGKLTAFKAYQPLFVTLTVGFLGYGFWSVYRKDQQPCDGDSCTTPISDRMVKIALWTATVLVVAAVTTEYWAPLFY